MADPIIYVHEPGPDDRFLPLQRHELAPLRAIGVTQGGIHAAGRLRLGRPTHPYHYHLQPLTGTVRWRTHEGNAERSGAISTGEIWQCP